ncbi:hypothetical protein RUM43_014012 [Polyplax serrata]|uniref:Tripeptidyl-peptidase 2 n=1 Tax=Polyplax serrata TaxID=468196 RepID=A0AAN8NIX2_POLSC
MSGCIDLEFPVWSLLPKKETGVYQFLSKYPEYDGRGIVIAIFDSGVDPGAAGLQKTSDGKVKLIERFDCSGAGDVNTSTIVEAKNGEITGLTGRTLKIPNSWKNPTGKYHLGVKNVYELYPKSLLDRMEKEKKEKLWDPGHKTAVAEASRKLQEFESKNNTNLGPFEKLTKQNLEAKNEVLSYIEKKYKDVGYACDCVVFHDGTMWRACLDTTEKGKLDECTLLGEYSQTHEYGTFSKDDQLNYSINVHNEGNILEIVSLCSGHGTHVASIASAYFPDEPEKNGIAPGAQIISLSIADNRITSMETGTALVRAMIKVMQLSKEMPLHVINMSYGEHANFSCSGRIGALMTEVVSNHNVTWVAAAGNHGPALCTIGTPPDINTNCIIGVGAYVSPEMMVGEYSMREKLPGMPFTWTSRGPTIDGDIGVTVCAPGGAITSMACYTLRGCQQLNGTSMASPHVAGAVAVLMSGLVQRGVKFSPFSVKRALENTATFLGDLDRFAQGFGLLQVEKAFEHLCQFRDSLERDVRFLVQCGVNSTKGIHMRNSFLDKPKEFNVSVEPVFPIQTDNDSKINFNMRFALLCDDTWVSASSHLDLMNITRTLSVRIDPTCLPEGVHSSIIKAYDVACPEKGMVFYIYITVVKPAQVTDNLNPSLYFKEVAFKPNTIKRHFIRVPPNSTWAYFRANSREQNKTGKFVLHCMQLKPKMGCKTLEFHRMFNVNSNAEIVHSFPCKGGAVLEVTVAKYWASLGDITMDYSVEFHGVKPDNPAITMQGADGLHTIELSSGVRLEEVSPVITLKNLVTIYRPSDSKIHPLCSLRDVIPPSRQIYEIILTYNFHLSKAMEISPNSSLLSDFLYESEFESQLWMLFDSNKQFLGSGDAYPSKYSVKVEKGDYTLKMHVRHEKKDLLEKLSELPLLLSQKMLSPVTLDVYASQSQALIHGKKMNGAVIPPGGYVLPIYVAPINSDRINKEVYPGHYLSGTITYTKDEIGKKADIYPFKYVLPEQCKKSSTSSEDNKEQEKDRTKYQEYKDSLKDLKISWLGKVEWGPEAQELYEELKVAYPENLAVHVSMLQCLEPNEVKSLGFLPLINANLKDQEKEEIAERSRKIIAVADEIISAVDSAQLLAYLGMKSDARADAGKIKMKMNEQKNALIDAYCRKGCALCRLYYIEQPSDNREDFGDSPNCGNENPNLQGVHNIWREVLKFAEPTDTSVIYFMMWHATVCGHYARLAKLLHKLQERKCCREIDLKLVEAYKKLGWDHCEKFLTSWIPVRYPTTYRTF